MDKEYEYLTLPLFENTEDNNRCFIFRIPHLQVEMRLDNLEEALNVIPNYMAESRHGGFRTTSVTLLGPNLVFLFEKKKSKLLLVN